MKKIYFTTATFLIVGASMYAIHRWSLDGVDGMLLGLVLPDDTVYAEQYSDAGFRQVAIGVSEAEVRRILGPPLEIGAHDGASLFRYTRTANDSNYYVRVIVFRDGRVSEKRHQFYVD